MIPQFSNPDARILAGRILYRNYPETKATESNQEHHAYMQRINPSKQEVAIIDYRGNKRTTSSGALVEINQLKQAGDLDDHQQQLLVDLEGYIKTRF